jgi:DNA gyrase subunit B
MFESNEYKELVEAHSKLVAQVGEAPFVVALEEREEEADTFAELRSKVMELAGHGVDLSRFKGLGEMDAEQLRTTTMAPESRTLARVTVDDAAALDIEQTFSDLMGDKVEPRREFIERHANEVRFLDV